MNAIALDSLHPGNAWQFDDGGACPYVEKAPAGYGEPPFRTTFELSTYQRRVVLQRELAEILEEVAVDQPEQIIPSPDAIQRILDLSDALPKALDAGSASITPSGEILLQWVKGRETAFAIKLGGNGKIYYAGKVPGERLQGAVDFPAGLSSSQLFAAIESWAAKADELTG